MVVEKGNGVGRFFEVETGLGRRVLIRLDQIVAVEVDSDGLVVTLQNGKQLVMAGVSGETVGALFRKLGKGKRKIDEEKSVR